MALREKGKPVPDHNQEQLFHAGIHQLLLVDKKGYPVLNEATAKEKLENMGEIVSSNSLTYNVNSVLQHIQRSYGSVRAGYICSLLFFLACCIPSNRFICRLSSFYVYLS